MYYNHDMGKFPSEEAPGISVFYKGENGNIFHTYSAYARGTETAMNTYNYLDLVPKGRDEAALPFTMSWLRHHNRYADGYLADADKPYWPADAVPGRCIFESLERLWPVVARRGRARAGRVEPLKTE